MSRRSLPAEALRLALIVRGWTEADLAREAALNPSTVRNALDPERPLLMTTETKILGAISRTKADPERVAALVEVAETLAQRVDRAVREWRP